MSRNIRQNFKIKELLLLIVALSTMFITGCQVKELEEREFPQAVSFDYIDKKLEVIFAFPDISIVTQQNKEEVENNSAKMPKLVANNMEEVLELYYRSSDKYLDLGHVQAIILGKGLISNEIEWQRILNYLEHNQVFARNVLVFIAEDSTDMVMSTNGESVESLGAYLGTIYKNNPYLDKKESITLGEFLNHWHNGGELLEIPMVSIVNEKPVILKKAKFEKIIYKNK
jgi:hypothetical protein